jgi:hypothetical protein
MLIRPNTSKFVLQAKLQRPGRTIGSLIDLERMAAVYSLSPDHNQPQSAPDPSDKLGDAMRSLGILLSTGRAQAADLVKLRPAAQSKVNSIARCDAAHVNHEGFELHMFDWKSLESRCGTV